VKSSRIVPALYENEDGELSFPVTDSRLKHSNRRALHARVLSERPLFEHFPVAAPIPVKRKGEIVISSD
jgi:hypothetical protein